MAHGIDMHGIMDCHPSWRQGHCGETKSDEGSCYEGSKGSWQDVSTPEDCLRKCEFCARCRHVSHSARLRDCSWYAECLTNHEGARTGHCTIQSPSNEETSAYRASGGQQLPVSFCHRYDRTPWRAVLGIFSIDQRGDWRRAHRETWMLHQRNARIEQHKGGILTKFVLRGVGAAAGTLREWRRERDVLFLKAPAALGRSSGPLISLVLWLRCASMAWPNADFIGKADDDVWIRVPSVALALGQAHTFAAATAATTDPAIYWGWMETFSWNRKLGQPVNFHWKWFGHRPCIPNKTRGDAQFVGPFNFAKGGMAFASKALVAQLMADAGALEQDVKATVRAFDNATAHRLGKGHAGRMAPYEDVYLGLITSLLANSGRLVAIHAGPALYLDGLESASPAAILVHGLRNPNRVRQLERWSKKHHCVAPRPWRFRCHGEGSRGGKYRGCSGAEWSRCGYEHNESACTSVLSRKAVSLLATPHPARMIR